MEHFVVSARKYRPQTFKDVVGQAAITNTLLNAIKTNHLAQALLFTGPRGVGKTTCARILAKMINTESKNDQGEEDFAFNVFELDAASNNSVDDIRNLTDQVRIPPQVGKYKVYIIDEVHMLSSAAFNAFLKTLEEPPKHCIFILATTEKHKIIPTILSRCQIYDFKRITVKDAKDYLKYIAEEQGIEAEDDALHIIAQKADGAMRDALSIFDRVVSFSGKKLTRQAVTENLNVLDYETYFESTQYILENKIPELLIQFNTTLAKGIDGQHYIAGLASHFRDLWVCKTPETIALLEVGDEIKKLYLEQSKKTSQEFLLEGINLANECDLKYKSSKNQRLLIELCLMQLASITFDGEKKNDKPFIIPASFFSKLGILPPKVVHSTPKTSVPKEITNTSNIDTQSIEDKKITPIQIDINSGKKLTSSLSLKGLNQKREHEQNYIEKVPETEHLPHLPFTQVALETAWNAFYDDLKQKGEHNLASILSICEPKIQDNHIIYIEFPNQTTQIELKAIQHNLLTYLKETLQNYSIDLKLHVNENIAKKMVYTPQEKYNVLKSKNPHLELFKQTFNLDV